MKNAILLVLSLIFSVSPCLRGGLQYAHAAGTRNLTLDQALSIAMSKNRDIEKAREYARYVQGRYIEERAAALPQLSLNGGASLAMDESQKALIGAAARQYSRTADISLTQPLFTWGKVGAAIRAATVGLKTADEQLRLYRQAAYRDVVAAFYDILLARELNRLAVENLAQKKRHLDEARRKFTAGVATDYDILAAEVAVENARPDVIRSANSIRTACEKLRYLLALEGEPIDVAGSLDSVIQQPRSYPEALATARSKRPELADAKLRIGIYDELVTIAAADNKPRLDLKGSAGWHWLDVTGMGQGQGINENGVAWNVGVYLTFPFFDGFRTSGRVTQARSDLHTRQIEESKLLDSVALEVRDAGNAVREAAEIVQALTGTVKQAERLLQMAEKGYEYGVKIRLEVDDAQLNLVLARSNLARAQRDYRVAQVSYEWAMGVAGE
ncbi:MAG: TolC family protein [Geobacteraceae bacterium]|nr:TolC family protein [Geobacteraceae bacterium]